MASAEPISWQEVRAKLIDSPDYSLHYDYQGAEGTYQCNYVVQGAGARILTEVLDGSSRGSGARILYDAAKDKDNVTVQTSFITLRRSLGSEDIKGSSLYQPLLHQMVDELVAPKPRQVVRKGDHSVFVFGDKASVEDFLEVDSDGNPVRAWRRTEGNLTKQMSFSGISWRETAISWP